MPDFIYLHDFDGNGRPTSGITNRPISQGVKEEIVNSLPSGVSVTIAHPEWIRASDLHVEADVSDMYITVLGDGARYRNAIGYYTYTTDHPPERVSDIDTVFIAFPNFSEVGKGGTMVVGERVQMVYKALSVTGNGNRQIVETSNPVFPAGTSIGFVLFQNGWRGNGVLLNHGMISSTSPLNPEPDESLREHFVNFRSESDGTLIIYGVEDINRNRKNCDNDFNDAVFSVEMNSISDLSPESYNSRLVQRNRGTIFCEDIRNDRLGHDFDYNDFVAEFRGTEFLSSATGLVRSIDLEFIGKHRGASYDHSVGFIIPGIKNMEGVRIYRQIYVGETDITTLGEITDEVLGSGSDRITVVPSTKSFLPSNSVFSNTVESQPVISASFARVKIFFANPIPRSVFSEAVAPYEVFMHVFPSGKVGEGNSSSYFQYSGRVYQHTQSDSIINVIPKVFVCHGLRDWSPPTERRGIHHAYPKIVEFLASGQTTNKTWFNPMYRIDRRCYSKVSYEDYDGYFPLFAPDVAVFHVV